MIVKPDTTLPDVPRICRTARGTKKVPFPSKSIAKRAMAQMQGWSSGDGKRLNVYRCSECRMWHVGHITPKAKS